MADYMTYQTIQAAIQAELKQTTGKMDTIIQYIINMVYLSEILSVFQLRPPYWLLQQDLSIRTFAPLTITGITQANPGVITVSGSAPANGNIVSLYGITGMVELNGRQGVVTGSSGSTFNIAIDTTNFTTYVSGGKVYHRGVSLSTNIDHVHTLSWNGQSGPMTPMTPEMMEGGLGDGTHHHNLDSTGCPTHFLHDQTFVNAGTQTDKLLWTPAPDAVYSLRMWYQQLPTRLSNNADVPLLPARTHDIIVAGSMARLAEGDSKQVKAENATIWPMLYQAGLQGLQKINDEWWSRIENAQQTKHFLS